MAKNSKRKREESSEEEEEPESFVVEVVTKARVVDSTDPKDRWVRPVSFLHPTTLSHFSQQYRVKVRPSTARFINSSH